MNNDEERKIQFEAYKGRAKGKLGGAIIGAAVGAGVGLIAAAAAPAVGLALTVSTAAMMAGGFATAGMLYGAHEFADAGGVASAVAEADARSRARDAEIKKDVSDIKAMLGDKSASSELSPPAIERHDDSRVMFWKVAAIGLVIGLAAGALLAYSGLAAGALHHFMPVAAEAMSEGGIMAASMMTLGLFGASAGINRDLFRKAFDVTDPLFKGILPGQKTVEHTAPAPALSVGKAAEPDKSEETQIRTFVYHNHPAEGKSETFQRDKVNTAARLALLKLDHTHSIGH